MHVGNVNKQSHCTCQVVLSSRRNNWLSKTDLSGEFLFTDNPPPPQLEGRIQSNTIIQFILQGGLFQSPHEDENDVQTISHKCKVLPFDEYTEKYGPDPKQYESVYDNNDTFYLAGHYDPTSIILTLENHIPSSALKASDKKSNKETK